MDLEEVHAENIRPSWSSLDKNLGIPCDSKYELSKFVLCKGNLGTGMKARRLLDDAPVFARVIDKKSVTENESRLLKYLSILTQASGHPNIINLHDFFREDLQVTIITDFCHGGELFDHLVSSVRFSEAMSGQIICQVLAAVAHLHSRGVASRDVKPENIRKVSEEDNIWKLSDFWMARHFRIGDKMHTSCGSPNYAAPEILQSDGTIGYDCKCDVWSCGVTLYAMLAGSLPFDSSNVKDLFRQIKHGLTDSHFQAPCWRAVTQQAQELLHQMINLDASLRLSALEASQHDWVRQHASARPDLEVRHYEASRHDPSVPGDLVGHSASGKEATQMTVDPPRWAMTLKQWNEFVDDCKGTELFAKLKLSHGHVNLYHINEHFVKPKTRGTGLSLALFLNRHRPLEAALMISHAWAEDVEECAEALNSFCSKSGISQETPIWFCLFSQYQPGNEDGDVGPTVQAQLALDPFQQVIHSQAVRDGHGMLVVHTTQAEVYSRLWCVLEIDEAVGLGLKVEGACSADYVDRSVKAVLVGSGDSMEICSDALRVQTSDAKCGVPEDEAMIRNLVEAKEGGFAALDERIFCFRADMVYRALRNRGFLNVSRPLR